VTALGRGRRCLLAAVSLLFAAALFRTHVASALVTRGDDLLRDGNVDGAVRSYARARRLDARSAVAADRLAFYLVLRGRDGDAARAYRVAGDALLFSPRDPQLLADRGFAAERLARWRAAESSFAAAGSAAHDPRYLHLAARMAERAHDAFTFRRDLRDALAFDASYAPARAALRGTNR
jgi:tetratricopeptide (TPR) repeat protein